MTIAVSAPSDLINRRYHSLYAIGQGSMGRVSAALDRFNGRTIALKQVITPGEKLNFGSVGSTSDIRLALAQEFTLLSTLRHPNIISVLDYGFDSEMQPFFTMELLENPQTIVQAGVDTSPENKVRLLIAVLQALIYLHRRGILHRDLKPSNVMVIDDRVKVLDFGLARRINLQEDSGGTLGYMAPWILMGDPANQASDLYAVGVIAYELFTGNHPFSGDTPSAQIQHILSTQPDLTRIPNPEIATVIGALLVKSPESAYQDAAAVLRDLSDAAELPLPPETADIRESFLQSAALIGREVEEKQLVDAFQAMIAGQGSGWLIGGESGVGKSRLLNELRTHALVEGALVLRGQATFERTASYQMWADLVRHLALHSPDMTDFEASVLKAVVPDITTLIGRTVADAPTLDPKATMERLKNVLIDLLSRHSQPIVMLLEDLQWTSPESHLLVRRLMQLAATTRLMVVGTYRDDEAPDLPALIPAHLLKLERLNDAQIAALSESMLGRGANQPEFVERLVKQTEGNVFFLTEYLRELSQEAGALNRVIPLALKQDTIGGIHRLVMRRFKRMPAEDLALLRFAAVFGHHFDLMILRELFPDTEAILLRGAESSLLEVRNQDWRFRHDKFRETLIASMSPEEKHALHHQSAEMIERHYEKAGSTDLALAYHWSQAEDADKEQLYSARGGDYALKEGMFSIAINLLEQAIKLAKTDVPPLERGHLQRLLGEAYYMRGQVDDAFKTLSEAVRTLGFPIAETPSAQQRQMMKQTLTQLAHLVGFRRKYPADKQNLYLETANAFSRLTQVTYIQQKEAIFRIVAMASLNMAERAPVSDVLALGYANTAVGMGILGAKPLAKRYARLAEEVAAQINDPINWAMVDQGLGVYNIGEGNFAEGIRVLEHGEHYARLAGDLSNAIASKALKTQGILYRQGKFDEARKSGTEIYNSADYLGDQQIFVWGNALLITLDVLENRLESAVERAAALERKFNGENFSGADPWIYSVFTLVHLRANNLPRAMAMAEKVLEHAKPDAQPNAFYGIEIWTNPAELAFTLWEQGDRAAAERYLTPGRAALKKFAGTFKTGAAYWQTIEGRVARLEGREQDARRHFEKALASARAYGLAYEIPRIEGFLKSV